MDRPFPTSDGWRLAPLALPILLPLCDPASQAQTAGGLTDPAAIDRAVSAFTGAATGTPGGARMAADPRLQLAACAAPLAVGWHGGGRSAVRVECAGPTPWRIFFALAADSAAALPGQPPALPAVRRGDAITIAVRGRGFSVQQPGEALESGTIGAWIMVRTARKGEPLRARIERPGLAVIQVGAGAP